MKVNIMNMTYEEIERKANEIIQKYQPDALEEIDVIRIAKSMGFVVGNIELDENEDGFIIVNDEKKIAGIGENRIIGINQNRSPKDKMFTIAHELGHYIFEKDDNKLIYAHRERKKKDNNASGYVYENKIDFFAACLLMPKESFIKKYNASKELYKDDIDSIVDKLSNIFGVTTKSVLRRIDEVGL